MASDRHLMRILVLQTLFAWEFRGGDPEAIFAYNWANGSGKLQDSSYPYFLLQAVIAHRDILIEKLEHFAPDWPYEKIALIDRACLLLGLGELYYSPETPALVTINEAVELAKEFGAEKSSKFINAVLSRAMEDQEAQKALFDPLKDPLTSSLHD